MGLLRIPIKFEDLREGQHVFVLVKSWFKAKRYWPADVVTGTVMEVGEKAIIINGRVGEYELPRISLPKNSIAEIWTVTVVQGEESKK